MPEQVDSEGLLLPGERRRKILVELAASGAVRVTALSEQFSVAEETIRRDLEKLNDSGRLLRTHGGAVSVSDARYDPPFGVRRSTNVVTKQRLARRAAEYVEEGDVVALDASSTVLELVRVLPDVQLTIITNSIEALHLLRDRPNFNVYSTGGELDSESLCQTGPLAIEVLRRFAITKAFLSCRAIDVPRGMSEASLEHAMMKQAMIDAADRSYLMVDHSKFGAKSVTYFGELTKLKAIVTDAETNNGFLVSLAEIGVATEIAD